MTSVLALSLLLATSGLQTALVVILVILGVLVVLAMVGGLVVFLRRRTPGENLVTPDESSATVESTAPAPSASAPAARGAGSGPLPVPGDAFAPRPPVPPPVDGPQPQPPAMPEPEVVPPPPQPPPVEAEVVPPPGGPPPGTGTEAPGAQAPAPISPTQTPDDVDHRSPAELAAAAQAAEAGEGNQAAPDNGAGPAGALQHEGAIGPPRPVPLAHTAPPDPARLRMLGLTLGILTERMRREHPPQLGTALARLVDSDQEAARSQLSTLALSLLGEDEEPSGSDGQLSLFLEEALAGEVRRGFSFSSMPEFQQALTAVAPELHEKLQTIVGARTADSVAVLTTEDVEALERMAVAMASALMLETSYDLRRLPGESAPDPA